ncbi:hypothetical protein [Bradyrhizobium sp. URHC0002]
MGAAIAGYSKPAFNIVHRTAALLREKFFQFFVKGVRLAGALDLNDDRLGELVDFPADISIFCALSGK